MMRICVAVPVHVAFRVCVVCVLVCVLKPCACVLHLSVPVEHLRSAVPSTARGSRLSMPSGGATGSIDGRDWHSKLTPDIKDAAIAELGRLYGGGASKPITYFNLKKKEEQLLARKLSWGLGICARPHAPARLKLRIASSSLTCADVFRAPSRGHRRCAFSATPRPGVRRGPRLGGVWPREG